MCALRLRQVFFVSVSVVLVCVCVVRLLNSHQRFGVRARVCATSLSSRVSARLVCACACMLPMTQATYLYLHFVIKCLHAIAPLDLASTLDKCINIRVIVLAYEYE